MAADQPSPFISLQHRNFRLLWIGQLISFSGSMMQTAAILWHVSLLVPADRRAIALGIVGLVRIIPIVIFSIAGGAVADAWDRRRVMLYAQTAMGVTAVALAVLTFRGLDHAWPIYALAAIGSAAGAFDNPARAALIPTLVPRKHLSNAISLNAIMFQIASVAGPAAGGIVIATLGVGWVYGLNALTFVCVLGALLMMRAVPSRDTREPSDVSLRAVRDGLGFVFSSPIIRSTMLLDFFATFFASATALLPIFAQDVLHVGARGYGWLYAAPSVGAMLTSVVMVRWVERIERRGIVLLWSVVAYGAATIVFGLSGWFWSTFICLAIAGGADMVSTGTAECDSSTGHAGPLARPHDRHKHGVLHGRPAAGRVGSRRSRAVGGSTCICGHRRCRMSCCHRVDCRANACVAQVSPQLH